MSPRPRIQISANQLTSHIPQAAEIEPPDAQPQPSGRGRAKRVEMVPLSRILPDEFQARTLLPSAIALPFFRFEIDCFEAARQWLEFAREDAGLRRRVDDLLSLGESLSTDGQIKAVTGSWQTVEGRTVFLLETGERRFWGSALRAVLARTPDDPLIEAVSVSEPSRVRQVIENEKYEIPNAVSRARSVAALILHFSGLAPERGSAGRFDFHRAALELRVSAQIWGEIERILGIKRPLLARHLQLLEFPDYLLELADIYNLPERVLREIRQLPEAQWEGATLAAIQQGLTSADIEAIQQGAPLRKGPPARESDPSIKAARRIKSALAYLYHPAAPGEHLGALADSLYSELDSPEEVLHASRALEDLAKQLRLRIQR